MIYIYDEDFKPVELLEGFNSLIWTNRWQELDDAQLVIPTSQIHEFTNYDDLIGLYLYNSDLEQHMLIDGYELTYDLTQGETVTIYALDLLDVLNRRIVWNQTVVSGSLTNCVTRLINENVIEPEDSKRTIDDFVIGDFSIGTHTIASAQFTGDTIVEALHSLCDNQDVNYYIKIENKQFVFYLEENQDLQNYVIFSKEFDNLISYDKLQSIREVKNVALVLGEGEGKNRTRASVNDYEGLDRKELFIDARDLSTNEGEISESAYIEQLQARGVEKLQELSVDNALDASIDTQRMYQYGVDYNIGDFVKIQDYRDNSYKAQITEYITSQDVNGISAYPNFEIRKE